MERKRKLKIKYINISKVDNVMFSEMLLWESHFLSKKGKEASKKGFG
jgi:hypothetical protein